MIELIEQTGTVNMHSSEAIGSAVEVHDALDEKEKANVANKDVLEKAVKEYKHQYDLIQDAFENKEYMTAMEGFYHHTIFSQYGLDKYCDEDMKTQVEKLQGSMEKELNRNPPKNGEILDRTSKPGRNTLTVKAGAYDVCVKLELENDPSNYVMFYIKAGKNAKVNILNGRYIAKITEGPI